MSKTAVTSVSSADFMSAKGPVRYRMINDYLFRAVFQSNLKALTGLLCSLLHFTPDQITSVTVTNPIELGKSLEDKTFVLDIAVLLNNKAAINLEMQVVNLHNWPERSLSYLCRSFDQLAKGSEYLDVKPVTQICFLDFTLFPEYPEFYATYRLLNIKNHNLYSDKFTLSVVDLNQIGAATEEDKRNHLDEWAALFKATEWEEIKMLTQQSEYLQEAAQSMYQLSADEKIRQQCEAREENERIERYMKKLRERLEEGQEKVEEEQKRIKKEQERIDGERKRIEEEQKKAEEERKRGKEEQRALEERRKTLEKEEKALAERQKALEKAKSAAEEARSEAEEARSEAEEARSEAEEARAAAEFEKRRADDAEAEIIRLRRELEALKK